MKGGKMANEISFLERKKNNNESINKHLEALKFIYTYIDKHDKINSVVEYFGGIGISGELIQNVFKPKNHIILEKDKECINILKQKFEGNSSVKIIECNSLEKMGDYRCEYISLDFPSYSLLKLSRNIDMFKKIFDLSPKYVDITDTIFSYIGVHRKIYSDIVKKNIITFNDYIEEYSNFVEKNFGYKIIVVSRHDNSSHICFARERKEDIIYNIVK